MLHVTSASRQWFTALATLLGACGLPFFPNWEESVAAVDEGMLGQNQVVELDTVVAAGSAGRVSVVTGGSGSCTRYGRTAVQWQDARTVIITPYNQNLRSAHACTADFRFIHHRVTVRYSEAGTYSVRVRAHLLRKNRIEQIADRAVQVR